MTSYKKPGKFNWVSLIVILVGLGLIYSLFQFGPPYYRKWKVKGVVSDMANQVYPKRHRVNAGHGGDYLEEKKKETVAQAKALGIEDPGLKAYITVNKAGVTVSLDYVERITHPFVGKVTKLRFRPSNFVADTEPLK